jgi:hypothetical protein
VVSGLLASTSVVPSLQAVEETFPKLLRGYASNFRTSDTGIHNPVGVGHGETFHKSNRLSMDNVRTVA